MLEIPFQCITRTFSPRARKSTAAVVLALIGVTLSPIAADATVPNGPTTLAGVPTPGQIALSWTAPSGGAAVTSYSVFEGTTPGGESYSSAVCSGSATTSCDVTSLANDATYYFTAESINGSGASTPSAEVTVSLDASVELQPYNPALYDVSCVDATDCTAVGHDGLTGKSVYVTETSGVWGTVTDIPSAAGPSIGGVLHGVSCVDAADCTAAGQDGLNLPTVATETGGTWGSATELSVSAGTATMNAIHCITTTSCIAVGFDTVSGNNHAVYAVESGGMWGAVTEVAALAFFDISCGDSTHCMVVGKSTTSAPMYDTWTSGSWGSPTALAYSASNNASFHGVSCVDANHCSAVGFDLPGDWLWDSETNGSWGTVQDQAPTANVPAPYGVSCWDANDCIAAGQDNAGDGFPYYVKETAGTWGSAVSIPSVNGSYVYGVSCPAAATCTMTGQDGYFGVGGSGAAIYATLAVPATPSGVTAVPGPTSATVSWNAPTSDGGAAITGYSVTATDHTTSGNGGETCTTSGTASCSVSGLTNGDSYTFAVTATNTMGTGSSAASSAVTPLAVPGAPTAVSAVAGASSAAVSWTAPGSTGGSTITGYVVTAADQTASANGGETCSTTGATTCTVGSLTNGDSYTFSVKASNGQGAGASSAASTAIVPRTTPGAPTGVAAVAAAGSATVSWTAPGSTGGSTITGYVVTAADQTTSANGGETCSTTGATTCTVGSLTNGDSYTFSVKASNVAGSGAASASSSAVTPVTVPGAPTGVSATAGAGTATVVWTAPSSNGGTSITGYTVTATDSSAASRGEQSCTTTGATTCLFTNLTSGDSYAFVVTATNSAGTSASSVASAAVTPTATTTAPANASPPAGIPTAAFGTPTSATASSSITTSVTSTSGGTTSASVSVPAAALPSGTVVSVYPVANSASLQSQVPAGQGYLLSFAVSWKAPDGSSPLAAQPITMTIVDPSIHAGDAIYEVTSSGLSRVGTATVDGRATVTFANDPIFAIAAVPHLTATTTATRSGGSVEVTLTCRSTVTCRGTAKLTVARRQNTTAKSFTHVTVAAAAISLKAGQRKAYLFKESTEGRSLLAQRAPLTHFRTTMLLRLSGTPRGVIAVVIHD